MTPSLTSRKGDEMAEEMTPTKLAIEYAATLDRVRAVPRTVDRGDLGVSAEAYRDGYNDAMSKVWRALEGGE